MALKVKSETSEQMTQNWTYRKPRIKEKHMTCEVVISSLHIILQLKTQVEGTYALNLLPRFFRYHENSTKYSSKNV